MENIVKILLEKGIDEETIHEVLSVISEAGSVDIPDFVKDEQRKKENAEAFHKMKAERAAKEKALQDKDRQEAEATLYAAKAWRKLKNSVEGK